MFYVRVLIISCLLSSCSTTVGLSSLVAPTHKTNSCDDAEKAIISSAAIIDGMVGYSLLYTTPTFSDTENKRVIVVMFLSSAVVGVIKSINCYL